MDSQTSNITFGRDIGVQLKKARLKRLLTCGGIASI
jgi:hypothetical protein